MSKKNKSVYKKSSGFKMKSSPAKLFGGKTRRMKLARKYELEDREERRQDSYVRGNGI
tara:strand:- start:437 stop:610 length:174 start_codon:yes stop_codon:yes gene_type:complete